MRLLAGRWAAVRRDHDSGFSLVEVMVALFSLSLVSIAAASFLVGGVRTTSEQSQKQNATALATQALEAVQAVPVSQVLAGRTQAAVQALLGSGTVGPLVTGDNLLLGNYDPSATAASVPVVPLVMSPAPVIKGITYQVSTAINQCYLSRLLQLCTALPAADAVPVLRATVGLTWGRPSCGRACTYAASVLLDQQANPVFPLSTSRPVIVTAVPDTLTLGAGASTVAFSGSNFGLGVALSSSSASIGSLTGLIRTLDGKRVSVTWTPTTSAGVATVALVNPDTGRAEYTPLTVRPGVTNDCLATASNGSGSLDLAVLTNDALGSVGAAAATVTLVSGGATVVGGTTLRYSYGGGGSSTGTATATYTVTVNGATSLPATATFKVRNGSCP